MENSEIVSDGELGELRELINENIRLTKETNHILHQMRFWGRVAFWAKVVIWCVVLSLPFILLSYLAPLFNIVPGGAGNTTNASSTSLFGYPSPAELQQFIQNKL